MWFRLKAFRTAKARAVAQICKELRKICLRLCLSFLMLEGVYICVLIAGDCRQYNYRLLALCLLFTY